MAPEALVEEDARGIGVEKTPHPGQGNAPPATERPQSEILRGFTHHGGFIPATVADNYVLYSPESANFALTGF